MLNILLWRILLLFIVLLPSSVTAFAGAVQVEEVSMATPDIIHVELRDPAFAKGRIVRLDQPHAEPNGTWVSHQGSWGMVIGPKRDHLRLADTPPNTFLDRRTVDDTPAYKAIGGRKIIAVYRKSMPYDSGIFRAQNGDTRSGASLRHDIYLTLDGPLPPGRHTIAWPDNMLSDTVFDFDDRSIRASAIHATQNGHRGSDLAKSAYLSLWLPGAPDQGALDFRRYGIGNFEILDEAGAKVFDGSITLRSGPVEPEPGNGLPRELVEYSDASADRIVLASLQGDTFTSIRPHNLQTGQRITLERLRGDQDASAVFATVMTTTKTGFAVADIDGDIPARLASGATATSAHRANRAGTFVFELDYSQWAPADDGTYRLYIPGLGVSDPIVIADDIWRKAALNSLAGLYHHRSGIPLDGRFGYSRPAAFRPGPELTIQETRLPLAWSSEFEGGFVPFADAAKQTWLTDAEAPGSYWGGYMDAGDWDRRIQHVEVSSLLLETFENTSPDKQLRDARLPKSEEFLEASEFVGTDGLPDLVHEAIWVLDFFRRLQMPDGSVRGGIESAEHPLRGEPSFLEHQAVFAYAPDHVSTYKYAAVAAKLARILKALTADAAAALFAKSAKSAWNAAERGFADPDAYYAQALEAGIGAGILDALSWMTRKQQIQALAGEYRISAAAAMFRLTGDAAYGAIFETQWRAGFDIYAHKGDAAWDYLKSEKTDTAIAAAIRETFVREAEVVVDAQAHFAYPSMKHPAAPSGWGQGGAPAYHEMQLLMRAHQISRDPGILMTMERAHHVMLGANQLGLSLVTGAGFRTIANPLHEDRLAMGVTPPAGITIYGWASQAQTAYGWIFGPPWSPLPEVGSDEDARNRRINPPRFSLPYFEYLVEHPALVMQQEYTVQQSIGTMAALALYIDAH